MVNRSQGLQESLGHANKVDLPSVGVHDIFRDEMLSGQSSDLCGIHLGQVLVVAPAKHLGAGLDASVVHELVKYLSCSLVELASSAVTLDGRLNTSEIPSAFKPVLRWLCNSRFERDVSMNKSQQSVNIHCFKGEAYLS
jgi:hypothetical protein